MCKCGAVKDMGVNMSVAEAGKRPEGRKYRKLERRNYVIEDTWIFKRVSLPHAYIPCVHNE